MRSVLLAGTLGAYAAQIDACMFKRIRTLASDQRLSGFRWDLAIAPQGSE